MTPVLAFLLAVNLVGDARMRDGTMRLTPAKRDRGGAVWRQDKETLRHGFETAFSFRISDPGGLDKGADGIAFVIQNHGGGSLGGYGGADGFASGDGIGGGNDPGIPYSLAVFLDTFKNDEAHDPSNNFAVVAMNGAPDEVHWPPPRLALAKKLPFNLKDGHSHRSRIVFDPPRLSVYLDDTRVLETVVDLAPVLDREGQAYVGFTASTGGGWANHDVFDWDFRPAVSSSISVVTSNISFALAGCLPERNLCTPAESRATETAPGRFHILLPAHLAVRIPNTANREPALIDAAGVVCTAGDAPSCGGPKELIQFRSDNGLTTFAVRDGHQGYFEFDVELR